MTNDKDNVFGYLDQKHLDNTLWAFPRQGMTGKRQDTMFQISKLLQSSS